MRSPNSQRLMGLMDIFPCFLENTGLKTSNMFSFLSAKCFEVQEYLTRDGFLRDHQLTGLCFLTTDNMVRKAKRCRETVKVLLFPTRSVKPREMKD